MSSLNVTHVPSDGIGQEKTIYGHGVRLKSKSLSTIRSTTLRITGMSSGAVLFVDVVVRPGADVIFNPPEEVFPVT